MSVTRIIIQPDSVEPLQPAAAMGRQVVRGSLWGVGGRGITILASLLATPVVIRFLGTEAFGVLALINVLIGYLTYADLGMGTASTKFGAEAHAKGDDKDEATVIWTTLLVSLIPTGLIAVSLLMAAKLLVERGLHLPANLHHEATFALQLAALGLIARNLAGVLNTPQLVRLRMDLHTAITTLSGVAQILLVPVVLLWKVSLVWAVGAIGLVNLVTMMVQAVVSQRLLPDLITPQFKSTLIRPLMQFGGALTASSLAALLLSNVEKLLLPRLASIAALAHYSVAFSIATLLTTVPFAMSQSLLPAFARLQNEPDLIVLRRFYAGAIRATFLWVPPAAILLCAGAKPFFTLWAGAEYGRESTLPFYILVAGLCVNVAAYAPLYLLMALGRTGLIARYHLLELPPYLVGVVILTYYWGAAGAALAWSLRVIIDAWLFFRAAGRITSFSWPSLTGNSSGYVVILILLPVAGLAIVRLSLFPVAQLVVVIIALTVWFLTMWKLMLREDERARLASRVRKMMGTV